MHSLPAYVYDLSVARSRAAALKAALPGVTVLYAVKANSHPAVVAALASACDGLDVASGGELDVALGSASEGGLDVASGGELDVALGSASEGGLVVLSGPAKTAEFLRAGVQAGAVVNVESATELYRLAALGIPARIALRVNRVHAGLDGSHRMTGVPTQFGVDEASVESVLELARSIRGVRVVGWHLHAVSNNLDVNAHNAFFEEAAEWAVAAALRLGVELEMVNLGGGFGIDYTGDRVFDPSALRVPTVSGVEMVVEPGRWLTAPAGRYEVEVLDLKRNHGRWFALVRGGTHHFRLPAAWGYSHPFKVRPVDHWPHPWPRPSVSGTAVDVAGELCTPRDILTRGQHVSSLRVGDVLIYENAGAYGWDISHHQFLRHPSPEFVILS